MLTHFLSGISSHGRIRFREGRERTAILVVHGIGSQRALEKVRGVIRGVWLDGASRGHGQADLAHPEQNAADIDFTVMTTSAVPELPRRRLVDFHELYWAHLMSETKAVAVLLWLYELPQGPNHEAGIHGLWWVAAIFLCLMNLLSRAGVERGSVVFAKNPQAMLVAPFLLIRRTCCQARCRSALQCVSPLKVL